MPNLSALANIPGYGAYIAKRQMNEQAGIQDLQEQSLLMGLKQKMQAQQQEQELKQSLSASGGDLEAAMAAALKAGRVDVAAKLAPIIEAKRKAQPQPQAIGSGGLRLPDGTVVPPAARPDQPKPQSIGSGGLRLPDGTIIPPAGGGSREPLHSIIGPDGKPVLVPRSQAAGKTPYNASIAGAGQFTPEALRLTAEQYLAGDRQAIQGYARNATARIALQNEIVKLAKERGMGGSDVAAQMADFAGIMSGSRTVGSRAANIELASSEALKMIDIVLERSKAFERTKFVPINEALKAFETKTGRPEVKAFGAAINSLVNVYARAISPSGVPTVSDKEHARAMLAQADSPEQVLAVMDVMKQEMQAARAAPGEVRDSTRRAVTGSATGPKKISNDSEYNALPSGTEFIGPDGKKRRKP